MLIRILAKLRSLVSSNSTGEYSNTLAENIAPVDSLDLPRDDELSPRHVAIIMDGNNRWSKENPSAGISGHRAGVEAIRDVLRGCEQHDVEVLTLFAFSSENWLRPPGEVDELMTLFEDYLGSEVSELHKQGIRLRFIGRRDRLKHSLTQKMLKAENLTSGNVKRVLVLAVDYGGRWDITRACQQFMQESLIANQDYTVIDESKLGKYLSLADLPELDLCIRTGGEYRVSNFLLWQCSYAEPYFTECYWPDFNEKEFSKALATYSSRQRRFGRTSEQLSADAGAGSISTPKPSALKSRTHA